MWIHFSVDDFMTPFEDLTRNSERYSTPWEQPIFHFFKELHEKYGAVFSCYCFSKNKTIGLNEVMEQYAAEFQKSSGWLRFGFHGANSGTAYGITKFKTKYLRNGYLEAKEDYEEVIKELVRITGGNRAIDRLPRIHYYAGSVEACRGFKEVEQYEVRGLLSAEDGRISYYLSEEQAKELQCKDEWLEPNLKLRLVRTKLRLENTEQPEADLTEFVDVKKYNELIVFTHDCYLHEEQMQKKLISCAEFATQRGICFAFPEDQLP